MPHPSRMESSRMVSTREILIYLDEGVGRDSFHHILQGIKNHPHISLPVKPINAKGIIEKNWEKTTAVLIFPGGRDSPYRYKLQGKGNQRIREYVEKGGKYLGFCAGAYYASASIEFEKGGPLEICAEGELNFFPGKAVGPLFGFDQFCYHNTKGSQAALIDWGGEELFFLYYKGGCTFQITENHSDVSVLARYASLPSSPPAIIHCKVGKGEAMLSGVHPEYEIGAFNATDPYIKPHFPFLFQSEEKRKELFQHLINLITLQ